MKLTLNEPLTCRLCGYRLPATVGHGSRYCELCRAADKHRHNNRAKPEIIVSVDSEGIQDANGNMHLFTLSYGREDGVSGSIFTRNPKKALLWLIEVAGESSEKRQSFHAFHFNYDIAILCRDFDESEMMLVHKAGARNTNLLCYYKRTHGIGERHTPDSEPCEKIHRKDIKAITSIITSGGEGDIIAYDPETHLAVASTPKRRLYVEYRPNGDRYDGWKKIDIHDHGTAFTGGLEKVIDMWQPEISPENRAIIKWGKAARMIPGELEANPEKTAKYSEAECVADARCARILIDTIRDATGIVVKPSKLYGSGSIAGAAFDYHGMIKRKETHDGGETVSDLSELCYFGGIIETPVVGYVETEINSEDINSAYPSHAISLPCMRKDHGEWRETQTRHIPTDALVGYVEATWNVRTPSTPPYVVHTTHKNVRQPLRGVNIWVTLPEWRAAIDQFGMKGGFATRAYWWDQKCECHNPLEWMKDLYAKRLAIKDRMKFLPEGSAEWQRLFVEQEAIKSVLNSCYGKVAQTRPEPGKYTNLHYAAYITGATRAQVRKRTWKKEADGATVVYQHTDSVKFTGGTLEDEGKGLGKWGGETPKQGMIILQPGLAAPIDPKGKGASRGVNAQQFYFAARMWAAHVDLTAPPHKWPPLTVPTRRMISRRMAIHRGKPELAGNFTDGPNGMQIRPRDGKRALKKAYPMPGNPRAWIVPPPWKVHNPATLEHLRQYRQMLNQAIEQGEFDA